MGLLAALIDKTDPDQELDELKETLALVAPNVVLEPGSNDNDVDYEAIGSYHNLHLLRGFALYVEKEGRPPTESERQADYPLRRQNYDGEFDTEKFPHLVDHSDNGGFYIPLQLDCPINTEDGASIGSVQGLLEELNSLREPLWQGSDAELKGPEVLWPIDERDPLVSEKHIWCQLRWLCRNALKFNLVIKFS